jgi:hypothetical protein
MSRLAPSVIAAVTLAATTLAPAPARASDCAPPAFHAVMGTLERRPGCGGFLGATDGSMMAYSYGLFRSDEEHALPLTVSARLERLGPDVATLEVMVVGAGVLLGDGQVGLYVPSDDVGFAWTPLPAYRPHDDHRIVVRQTADQVVLEIDGARVMAWSFRAPAARAAVSLGFKGARGYRSWALFGDVRVESQ